MRIRLQMILAGLGLLSLPAIGAAQTVPPTVAAPALAAPTLAAPTLAAPTLAAPTLAAPTLAAPALAAPAAMRVSVASRESEDAAQSQGRAVATSRSSREPAVRFNVLFHVGGTWLTAKDSFDAILGQSNGVVFGGGGEAVLRSGIFIRGDVSRFNEEGERVFVSNGQVFPLGQPLTITLTPIEFTGGYRFTRRRPGARGPRLVPYAGGGVGVVRYREESESDTSSETISESFTSYHVLGGLDVAFSRMFSAGAEFHHRWVPDGLGKGGVSQAFDETDLGGSTFRALFRVHF